MAIIKITPKPPKLNDEEYMIQAKYYVDREGQRISAKETTNMFSLYNDRFTPPEYSTGCHSCVIKVFKRIKKEYERLSQL
jgi:hypothetical protein